MEKGGLTCFEMCKIIRGSDMLWWKASLEALNSSVCYVTLLLRGTIVNRTYGIHKNQYV